MAHPTNIVALVENDFLTHARGLMKERENAFLLYQWAIDSLNEKVHLDEVGQLVGELINEVFALNVQLNGRENNK